MCWIKKIPIFRKCWPRRLSWKLTLIYAILFSAVLVVLNAGILFGLRYYLIRQIRIQVQADVQTTLSSLEKTDWNGAEIRLPTELEAYPETGAKFVSTDGAVTRTVGILPSVLPDPTKKLGQIQVLEYKDTHTVVENVNVTKNGKMVGCLQVAYNMRAEYRFLKLLFLLMAVADAAGILISMAVGAFISRRALRPIAAMTSAAKAISGSDLTKRVTVGEADDELSRLARTFNEMIARLESAFERQKRFVSDASHELRTPIAVIQGYADLIRRWGKDDPAVLHEAAEAIGDETESMKTLVERLLFLARSDNGSLQVRLGSFELQTVLQEVADETRFAFGRSVAIQAEEAVIMTADRALIKQMLRALTENAVKYTPDDGRIVIEADRSENSVILTVRDTGAGIPPADLPHVFDRFYRVDKARSRAQGGNGLGLAIVRDIVKAHRGTVNIESTPGRGTAVCVTLPQ